MSITLLFSPLNFLSLVSWWGSWQIEKVSVSVWASVAKNRWRTTFREAVKKQKKEVDTYTGRNNRPTGAVHLVGWSYTSLLFRVSNLEAVTSCATRNAVLVLMHFYIKFKTRRRRGRRRSWGLIAS